MRKKTDLLWSDYPPEDKHVPESHYSPPKIGFLYYAMEEI